MLSEKKSLKEIEKLIEVYQKAQQNLIRTIAEKEAKGNVTKYQKSLLQQINQQLAELNLKAKELVKSAIPIAYQEAIDDVNQELKKLGVEISSSFSKLHTEAINVMIMDTLDDLYEANKHTGDQIKQVVKKAVDDAVTQKIAQGQTIKQCKNAIIKELMARGIEGIETKNGNMMSLDAYAALTARSRTREATNTAKINQLSSNGYDLVKMSSHNTSCPICAVFQGRVFSISGNDNRYPPLSKAFSGPYANIHPNCSHVIMPYIEALADDPEKDRQYSNLAFDTDKRSQEEIDIYNEMRKKKQKLRENRRQWERYSLAIPENTPKTFQAFMNIKRSNNERWKAMQQEYVAITKQIKDER